MMETYSSSLPDVDDALQPGAARHPVIQDDRVDLVCLEQSQPFRH